ncbi:MAG: hypothetical protein Q3M24_00755 [Candidatus Electrothrix aestuarii]|uniref:Antitoxin n=1 Tax=Candidatus Electrothrix aestuarii TaxID=3062594 RepID=A0AAU8LWU7_9BACT|nr:hypothetical protein [Candidatus Electrothrix aestuarii]WPD22279.1 MAG: hypothetical protein SD837_19060 [Candidatus Electrothrix sp. GW3-3]
MKKLIIEMPEKQHQAITAKALLSGMSLKKYVLKKLEVPETDLEEPVDIKENLKNSLQEMIEYRKGKKALRLAGDVLAEL